LPSALLLLLDLSLQLTNLPPLMQLEFKLLPVPKSLLPVQSLLIPGH
jgi:hypothetical protein